MSKYLRNHAENLHLVYRWDSYRDGEVDLSFAVGRNFNVNVVGLYIEASGRLGIGQVSCPPTSIGSHNKYGLPIWVTE